MQNAGTVYRMNWNWNFQFVVVDVVTVPQDSTRGAFTRSPTPHSHAMGFFLAGLALQCFFELPVCKNTVLNQNPWQRHYQVLIRLKVVYHQLPERDIIPFLETMKERVAQTEKIKF